MLKLGLIFSVFVICVAAFAEATKIPLSSAIRSTQSTPFITHTDNSKFGSYLVMNLPYTPLKELHARLEKIQKVKLKNRGEAHITVITPVEFSEVLAPVGVTIQEINEIATQLDIQKSSFDIICLGRSNKDKLATYYIVVKSEDLLKLRGQVEQLYLSKGGSLGTFSAKKFYPHITVGFTKRDLHESDGAIKDEQSCIAELVLD